MRKVLTKKIIVVLLLLIIMLTCSSCRTNNTIKTAEYLKELASLSGISNDDDYLEALKEWEIVQEDYPEKLDYAYLTLTLQRLLSDTCDIEKLVGRHDDKEPVNKEDCFNILEVAIEIINNKEFTEKYEYQYQDGIDKELEKGSLIIDDEGRYQRIIDDNGDKSVYEEADYTDIYKDLKISNTYDIDFSKAEDVSYLDDNTLFVNHEYRLLSAVSKSHSFFKDGFNVAYSLSSSGINVRVSKKKDKLNFYYDVSIYNVRPSYNWDYEDGKLKEAYFKLDYQTTDEIGISSGKYLTYYLDLKDLDSKSFKEKIKAFKDDEVEETLKICTIRTPIPNVPYAYLNIDVLIKIYASGRVETVLYNSRELGFEIKDGKFRLIMDNSHDVDLILKGSARAVLGLNFNLETAAVRLMDVEVDAGVRASVSSTLHLYDEEGEFDSVESELSYETLEELSQENSDVKLCGDVSFHWLLNVYFNTSRSLLSKWGFSRTRELLDDDNQIFGNMTHIEDGHFVEKCTRKARNKLKTSETISSDKLSLERYAVVVDKGKSYVVGISSLPSNYKKADLVYSSSDDSIASISGNSVIGKKGGSCQICVKTSDGKYSAYLNVLVSES